MAVAPSPDRRNSPFPSGGPVSAAAGEGEGEKGRLVLEISPKTILIGEKGLDFISY